MTRQTPAPLDRLPINTFNRSAVDLAREVRDGTIDMDPPYQRGLVWDDDQRVALVYSLLSGLPIPTLILNQRPFTQDGPPVVVIDGKQRLTAVAAWYAGELAVPASWFPADEVAEPTATDDGPYVTFAGLTLLGQRRSSRAVLPVGETRVATVREEAEIYLLVNGQGTPQTADDMTNAAQVANS